MNIGFIGIGQMGQPMSNRILDAGYSLTVHDLKKEAAIPLLEKGAKWGNTPKKVAKSCQVVFSSLPTPQSVEEVVYGDNGLRMGWKDGDIYVDMSTNSPSTIRKIAEDVRAMGVTVLDAPVSGGNGGMYGQPTGVLFQRHKDVMRASLKAAGVTPREPEEEFYIGRINYAKGIWP